MTDRNQTAGDAAKRADELNRDFYETCAADFSRTRRTPWPGWKTLLARPAIQHALNQARANARPLRVLDAGCGNGRFASLLAGELTECELPLSYLGLDRSRALIAEAQKGVHLAPPHQGRFVVADLETSLSVAGHDYDLVSCFGVFHHIPTQERRVVLLASLAGTVGSHGVLAVSYWRFQTLERVARRAIASDLEPGAVLLPWGGDPAHLRFCQQMSEEQRREVEEEALVDGVDSFTADGANGEANLYRLYRGRTKG